MSHRLFSPQRLFSVLLLSLGVLGCAHTKQATPVGPALSGRDVRANGFGPWSFDMPEARMSEFAYCKPISGSQERPGVHMSSWTCPLKMPGVKEGLFDVQVKLTFVNHQLYEFYILFEIGRKEEKQWKPMAAQVIAFVAQGAGTPARVKLPAGMTLAAPVDANNAWDSIHNPKNPWGVIQLLYPEAWGTESYAVFESYKTWFLHRRMPATVAAAASSANPPPAVAPETAAAMPVLSAKDVRPDGFGPWTFHMSEKIVETHKVCGKMRERFSADVDKSSFTCDVHVQAGDTVRPVTVHLDFAKGLLQEIWFNFDRTIPKTKEAWVQMATPAFVFLQNICPGQSLQSKVDKGLQFSGEPTVEKAATIIQSFQHKVASSIYLECPLAASKTRLRSDADKVTFLHEPAQVRPPQMVEAPPTPEKTVETFHLSTLAGLKNFALGMSRDALWKQLKALPKSTKCEESKSKRQVVCAAFPLLSGRFPVWFGLNSKDDNRLFKITVPLTPPQGYLDSRTKATRALDRLLAYLRPAVGEMGFQAYAEQTMPTTAKQILDVLEETEWVESDMTLKSLNRMFKDTLLKVELRRVYHRPHKPLYTIRLSIIDTTHF